jgi:glutaredoxin 3
MSTFFRRFFSSSPGAMTPAEKAQQLIAENPVMVFSKSWCSYSNRAKQVLRSFDAEITVYELDRERDGSAVQDALEDLTGQRTVPNIFIAQKHIGGSDDLMWLARNRKQILATLRDAGALPGSSPAPKPEKAAAAAAAGQDKTAAEEDL